MGQASSKEGDADNPAPSGGLRGSAEKPRGLKAFKRLSSGRSSTSSIESNISRTAHVQSADAPPAAGSDAPTAGLPHAAAAPAGSQPLPSQAVPAQQLPPRPPPATTVSSATTLQPSYSGSSTDSSSIIAKGFRRSGSMEQRLSGDRASLLAGKVSPSGSLTSLSGVAGLPGVADSAAGKPPQQPGRRSSSAGGGGNPYSGQQNSQHGQASPVGSRGGPGSRASFGSASSFDQSHARASFSRDALAEHHDDNWRRVASLEAQGAIRFSNAGSVSGEEPGGSGHALKQSTLDKHNLLHHQQQLQGPQQGPAAGHDSGGSGSGARPGGRASMDSVASHVSAKSGRSSFANDAADAEVDHYGRPSFAPFESVPQKVLEGKGAVFEASLPADLAIMYRRLAVLLPQAPVPLVTVLQLWGCTDPQEAQENVQIFVMQGVLKVATLPDGATWLMVSPDHQQYLLAAHPGKVKEWHLAVLDMYRRQTIGARLLQQRRQLQYSQAGEATAAAAMRAAAEEQVLPSQFVNDGYIWLALTHHLLGAGQLDQLRALLLDPAWLEGKLHCYGVAAVVDDFRNYLQQVGADLLVKAVLQAFQMSLSCCMERSHLPMMRTQLVLRLMAAAQAAATAAAAATPLDGPRISCSSPASVRSAAPVKEGQSNESLRSRVSAQQQQEQYNQEMTAWYGEQYKSCWEQSQLLRQDQGQQQQQDPQQQQQQLPPHLVGYIPSLTQAGGRHRMALRGHLGAIRRVVITPDGKDVLTASDDGGVQVWDMDIGDCIMQLRPAEPSAAANPAGAATPSLVPLTVLAVTPDGCCCLCGDAEGWLACWNLKTGQLVQRVRAHKGSLNALVLDSSGSRCMTAGQDCTARLWSLPASIPGSSIPGSGGGGPGGFGSSSAAPVATSLIGQVKCEMEMRGHGLPHLGTGAVLDVALSADGVLGATASDDFSVKIWDLDQHECVKTCKGHSGWVVSLRFVGTSHTLVSASHDETARAWDAWSGECLAVMTGHAGRLNAVRSSADGRVLITCSDDMTARVWETRDYTCVGVLAGHTGWINDVALVRNGRQAVTTSGDGTARLWDTQRATCLQVLTGHSDDVTCVVLTSRGRFAVTGSVDGTAQVWDLAAQDVSSTDVHEGKVMAVVAANSSSSGTCHAASIGADGCLRLWDVNTGTCISNKTGHMHSKPQGLTMVADGSRAFSAGGDRKLVAWDLQTGDPSICLPRQQGSRTRCICVSADGRTAVTLLFDSSMAAYNTSDGSLRAHLMQRGDRDAQRVHSGGVNAVLLSSDGSRAVSVSKDCTARVWDTATGACLLVLQGHEDSVHAAALNDDEALLATASYDSTVRLWSMQTGYCLKVLQHTDPVLTVAFSPPIPAAAADASSSTRLVTGCEGRALWLWDVETGACVAALGEHKEAVTAVAFSPDGTWLASASQDRSVVVWDAATGQLAGLYVGDATMVCCCFAVRTGTGHGAAAAAGQAPDALAAEPAPAADAAAAGHGGSGCDAASAASRDSADSAVAAPAASSLAARRLPPTRLQLLGGSSGSECRSCVSAPGLTLIAGDASGNVHFIPCCTAGSGGESSC